MTSPVDLQQWALERPASGSPTLRRRRIWLTRWGIPLAIVGGFAGLMAWAARDRWLPAQSVTVVPVLLAQAEIQQAGTPLFQAAGWLEPRPTAVVCSALAEGSVAELLVVEGQEVEANAPVAKLVDADARLALGEAEAALRLREAEREAAQAALTAAQSKLDRPVHLEASLAEAEASLANVETEQKNLPFLVQAAEARLALARHDLEGKQLAADAIAGRAVQRAQSELDAAAAALAELEQRRPSFARQTEACRRVCQALQARLRLKTDETRDRDEAQANLAAAEARVQQARLAVEASRLRLDRMVVRAPIAGRVLALHARPGQRLLGSEAAAEPEAGAVATLYDPEQMQVRVDVRLEDVPRVQVGQGVEVTTAAATEPLAGRVLAITARADAQKNTLEVKVSIDRPSPHLRPEVLAQVRFLVATQPGKSAARPAVGERLWIARSLLEAGEGGATVWVADQQRGVARRRTVEIGRAGSGELVEVTQGLNLLDKLIASGREGLVDGSRIRITGTETGAARWP